MRIKSIPEYFERRFNSNARYLATFMTLVFMVGYIAIQFLTLATALYRIFGIPLMLTVVLIAIATTLSPGIKSPKDISTLVSKVSSYSQQLLSLLQEKKFIENGGRFLHPFPSPHFIN